MRAFAAFAVLPLVRRGIGASAWVGACLSACVGVRACVGLGVGVGVGLGAGLGACGSSGAAGSAGDAGVDAWQGSGAGDGGSEAASDSGGSQPGLDAGVGAPGLDGGLDPASHGGTITFESIGAAGWYPSRRDPDAGPCDAYQSSTCCLAKDEITSDQLTPWDEDLILTLRGPMLVSQMAVYQPGAGTAWNLVSSWSNADPAGAKGIAFDGNKTETTGFPGSVGTECLVNVSTSKPFACGPGSSPYCPAPSGAHESYWGWSGSKLFVLLATMPHAPSVPGACSTTTTGNWYDAPWIGLSVGELVRAGAFVSCQCYAKDPTKGYLADGCGQFNVFEVVNDNDSSKNLDVFSTDMIDYAGYVGQGPCGPKCAVSGLGEAVDLIDKSTDTEAAQGAVASPEGGPGDAFRRPENGYRYFLVLLDVPSRTVQLAMVHPLAVPSSIAPLLPQLPASVDTTTVDAVRALRLPH
jgi:hypothetical protein